MEFPRSLALDAYRKLLLARRAEERIQAEYHKDEMKTPVHLGVGGEAISVGVWLALPPGSSALATYRNHNLYLAMTEDADGFFGELFGRVTGPGKGRAGSMHLAAPGKGLLATSAIVGTTIPVAVGAAFANAYRDSKDLVASFFGEGATDEGVFWESLNFACLKRLRLLFICEDNGLAIHSPASERRGYDSLLDTVKPFRCHADEGDGADLVEVYARTRALLDKMAADPRPGVLRLSYLRFLEHVGVREDFDACYRPRPTEEVRRRQDPLLRFEQSLRAMGFTESELEPVRAAVLRKVDAGVEAARAAPHPRPEDLDSDVFA